jgi:outer membrane protein OmpA-like peptidoglycan-associated protein
LSAQNVTVINRFHGEPIDDVPENYVLSGIKEQTIIINDYEPALNARQSLLNQMINYGLKAFVDNNYLVKDGQVRVYPSVLDFDESVSALIKNAIWINDLPFSELFPGFSDDVLDQASYLTELNGLRLIESGDQSYDETNALSLYEFQSLVFSFKESAIAEATNFIVDFLPAEGSQITGYQISYLVAEEFELMSSSSFEDGLGDLSLNPDLFSSNKRPSRNNRRGKNNFSEEVVTLLEENNRILSDYSVMFQNLQSQIDDINRKDNSDLREDMAEMRQMISDLKDEPSLIVNDEDIEYLIFDKNEFSLSQAQKARLNKTIVLLVKNPSKRALVTGYADKSGDAEYNAWISKQRAESVKNFLESMGIEKNRLVVTYLGESESTTSSPADRRVEVSLIN